MFYRFSKGKVITTIPNGIGDNSAYFDGSSYAELSDSNLPMGNSARSISLWFYKTSKQNEYTNLVRYGTEYSNYSYSIGINDSGYIETYGCNNTLTYNNEPITLGKWYHVVITFNTDYTEQCYLNGVLVGTQTHNGINTHAEVLSFANWYGVEYFQGNLKELNVYNRVLSADEVSTLYNKGKVTDGLVLDIPLQYGKDDESMFTEKNFVYDYSIIETSSGFNTLGKPIRYRSASQAGVAFSTIPKDGLVFYAPCETDTNVEIGNQFTTSGEFTTQVADSIPCLKFTNSYRQEVDTSVFIANQVTLSAWYYKITTNNYAGILGYGYDSVYHAFCLQESYGQFTIERASGRFETGYNMEDNKWYHLAVTLDNDTIKAYVNGELVNTFTYSDMYVYDGNIGLGGWVNGGYSPNGYITKARIYNRPLTEKEIQALAKEIKIA